MPTSEGFGGKIGRTFRDSEPWWPSLATAPQDRPNVVVVLFDDLGFAHLNCYGSTIETPNINRLAANGLRFTNFHVTPLCSPTRAALLTGRNHHTVGIRAVTQFDTGFPHMSRIPRSAATLAEVLREEHYATFAVGKWHLAPVETLSQAGPFHDWPLQRGFDRYYGFLPDQTDQFYPELVRDNHLIDPPRRPEDGYHLSEDLTDQAIGFLRDQQSIYPQQPFFLYFAFGATHAPHQAPQEWIDKYRGRFDAGWDQVRQEWYARQLELGVIPPDTQLAPPNPGVPAWDQLPPPAQRFAIALQEAFAGFLAHADAQIGRLLSYLEAAGQLDRTIFLLMADNGASQEGGPFGVFDAPRIFPPRESFADQLKRLHEIGGPRSASNIPWGWAQAGNTPLRWYKQNTHGGGVRVPLIAHWPDGIAERGGIRRQFHHVTDVLPTVLDLIDASPPQRYRGVEQVPIAGSSFAAALSDADAPTTKSVQYFEMFGHRGIWADGWKAVTRHERGEEWTDDEWELYHLDEDFSETHNLAEQEPERLRALIDRWWVEAGRHGVLPLDDRLLEVVTAPSRRSGGPHDSLRYHYTPPISHLPRDTAPALDLGSWTLEASISRSSESQQGVLFAIGSLQAGAVCYLKDNRLHFDHHYLDRWTRLTAEPSVPVGGCVIGVSLQSASPTGPGQLTLSIDGETAASGELPALQPRVLWAHAEMDIGRDGGSPAGDRYEPPFEFEGELYTVEIEVTPYTGPSAVEAAQIRQREAMSRQ